MNKLLSNYPLFKIDLKFTTKYTGETMNDGLRPESFLDQHTGNGPPISLFSFTRYLYSYNS